MSQSKTLRKNRKGISYFFTQFAKKASEIVGKAWAFLLALILILVWIILGPIYHYSDTWQLIINTATTIITFLMVFLIQNTQNRDTEIINLKLDELIRSNKAARNTLIDLTKLSDEELKVLEKEYQKLCNKKSND